MERKVLVISIPQRWPLQSLLYEQELSGRPVEPSRVIHKRTPGGTPLTLPKAGEAPTWEVQCAWPGLALQTWTGSPSSALGLVVTSEHLSAQLVGVIAF